MVDMESTNPVPFPEEAQQAWAQIEGVGPLIPKLEIACSYAARAPDLDTPGKIKSDLKSLRDALRNLILAAESIGYGAGGALALEGSMSDDERLQYFGVTNKYEMTESHGLAGFFRDVYLLEELTSLAVESQRSTRGRPTNNRARLLACLVKLVFDKYRVDAKSYQDGAFFRTLDVAFSLVLPELGPEAYRRYADWALKNFDELIEASNRLGASANAE